MKTLNALLSATLALVVAAAAGPVTAQTGATNASTLGGSTTKVDRSIEYHGGPVLSGVVPVYLIGYGCWGTTGCQGPLGKYNDLATLGVLVDFMSSIGNSPYMQINQTYADSAGHVATPSFVYAGAALDNSYAHGSTLTEADLQAIILDQILGSRLPQDPQGIYVVLTTADITLVDGTKQFCLTCCNLHGHGTIYGTLLRYVFVGNPSRCPGSCGASPNGEQTPNGNYAADQMASWLAHALNGSVTDPHDDAWYDRNGLENAEKCEGTYGATYSVTNPDGQPAQANVRLGQHHFLLQQNWVNGRKGHCALAP